MEKIFNNSKLERNIGVAFIVMGVISIILCAAIKIFSPVFELSDLGILIPLIGFWTGVKMKKGFSFDQWRQKILKHA